ncbi:MAG: adenylate kinase [Chloroflexi bacterium]|nr:adenylate kinase [Chloroflexota bacterium]MCL5074952.1 adenylate kinase [Chloroflexota bacterium]
MYIILLGAPGAGKGTQAKMLATQLQAPHISSGDLFRAALRHGTKLGQLAKSYMERGLLVPDEITIDLIRERLAKPDCGRGAILDGFPRTINQAKALDAALHEIGKSITRVLYIDVSEDKLVERLSGRWLCRNCEADYNDRKHPTRQPKVCPQCGGELYQRPDDKEETVRTRLGVYFTETAPLIKYYEEGGLLIRINGEQSVENVQRDILAALQLQFV